MKCPRCGSEKVVKKGMRGKNQRYSCSCCNAHFTENRVYKSSPKLEPLNLNCPHCGSNHVVRDGKLETESNDIRVGIATKDLVTKNP